MKLSDLQEYSPITIQCHDNPDADSIAAGFGLYCYFKSIGKDVRMIYCGETQIKKTNLKLMVDKLGIPLEYVSSYEERIMGLLITVDCQYGAGNVSHLDADFVAVVDHHHTDKQATPLCRIQSNLGSCSTLVWCMLLEVDYPIINNNLLSTALYYGLYTDTNQFSEIYDPLDLDMRETLLFNKGLINTFRNSNLTLKELEIAGVAMLRCNYNEEWRFAVIQTQECDSNILGIISDFLIQVDEIDACVVFNERSDAYKYSVRSCVKEIRANELAVFLMGDMGSGGGHFEKAGGRINKDIYKKQLKTMNSEVYFEEMMIKYFEFFSIIYAKDFQVDIAGMELYKYRNMEFGYVELASLMGSGESVILRTQDGDMELQLEEESYLVIDQNGTLMLRNKLQFEYNFICTEEKFSIDPKQYTADYFPTIKAKTKDKMYAIIDYVKRCNFNSEKSFYAQQLDKGMKLFPVWDEEKYILGNPGDYLLCSRNNISNINILPCSQFERYCERMDLATR